jgi:regulator of protease activity HflC (stomatin/prohibitin superfamily)
VHADIFYTIEDPEKAIKALAPEAIASYIQERAVATLGGIIRSSTYSRGEVGNSGVRILENSQVEVVNEGDSKEEPAKKRESFANDVHHQFVQECGDILQGFGIKITDLRINESKVTDEQAAHALTQMALRINQLDAEARYATTQAEIKMTAARNEAEMVKVGAGAKAEALVKQATAEKEAAALLASVPLAADLKKLERYAQALGPNSKIIFNNDPAGNPLAGMFGLFGGDRDSRMIRRNSAPNLDSIANR